MDKEQKIERLSYSVQEAADALGVSSRMVHDYVKDGTIAHFRIENMKKNDGIDDDLYFFCLCTNSRLRLCFIPAE